MGRRAACLFAVLTFLHGSWATPGAQTSPVQPRAVPQPVLVELFTSEGCSSCPPADDLLRELNGRTTAGGQRIIGLSEHVTYWNRLGWTDPYSQETFTSRQSGYANRLHLDDVYTPQMVVNGREQFVGGNAPALLSAVAAQASRAAVPLRILSVQNHGDRLDVRFGVGPFEAGRPLQLMAAFTDDMATSRVQRGENAGRELRHVAVVRSLANVATITAGGDQSAALLPPRSGGTPSGGAHTLVLFLQEASFGPVVGIATQRLP